MDQVTQQNAALVEEAAAATESMQIQAQQLSKAVSVFRLDPHDAGQPVAVRRSPAPAKGTEKPSRKLVLTSA